MRGRRRAQTPSPREVRRRDRRGRGLRGPLAPPDLPVVRTRAERFDDGVLEALDRLDRRWTDELASVQVLVEEVPAADQPSQTLETGLPLGRVDPGARRRPARLIVYRRPIEARSRAGRERDALTRAVLVGLLADLLGRSPEDIDPDLADGTSD